MTGNPWFKLHRWLGLSLGLVLFLICFSGTLAVFAPEIDWLFERAWQVNPRASSYDWEAMFRNVRREYPTYRIQYLMAPPREGFAAQFLLLPVGGEYINVLVNPYTGRIQGETSYWNVWRFFRSLHRRFFLPNPAGLLVVTGLGLFLLISLVTGLISFKKWWRYLLRVRWGKKTRVFLGDFHKVVGTWCLLVGLVLALTGVWYLVELFAPAPPPDIPSLAERRKSRTQVNLNQVVETVRDRFDRFEPRQILFKGPGEPIFVGGQTDAWFLRDRAQGAAVNPVTGEVLAVREAGDLNLHQYISHMADPLHFGTWGGLVTKTIWFVVGLGLSAGILTGVLLWAHRTSSDLWGSDCWLVGFGTLVGVSIILLSGVYGTGEARFWMQRESRPPIPLATGTLAGVEGTFYGLDSDADRIVERISFRARTVGHILPTGGHRVELRRGTKQRDLNLRPIGLRQLSGTLSPGIAVNNLEDFKIDTGSGRLTLSAAGKSETGSREHRNHHPAYIPVSNYVWWVIGLTGAVVLGVVGLWLRLLLG